MFDNHIVKYGIFNYQVTFFSLIQIISHIYYPNIIKIIYCRPDTWALHDF